MENGQKEKGKLLISIIIGLLVLIVLIVIGNVVSIGNNITEIHPILSYLFYAIVVMFFIWFIVLPIFQVIITPPLTGFNKTNISNYTPSEITEYIKKLKIGMNLTREEERDLSLGNDRKKTIEKILNSRCKEMEEVVRKSAVSNFVITAISQNGSLDFISSMVINFKMINEIVKKLGKRPSYTQLIKLYIAVISASLLITTIDDILDDVDFSELLGNLGGIAGKALNIVIPSATNGLMNAFVTLRVGYTTIKYLEVGNENFDKQETRKFAIKLARKQLLSVGKEGVAEATKKIGKMLNSVVE